MLIGVWCVVLSTFTLVGLLQVFMPRVAIADTFDCYQSNQCESALASSHHCQQGRDYTITTTRRDPKADVVVLSIHGGKIELHTSEISQALAQQYKWNRYDFAGHGTAQCLDGGNNFDILHITSSRFDEPEALELVKRHPKAVSIHGYGSQRDYPEGTICVGGKNANQVSAFISFIENNEHNFTEYLLNPIDATQANSGDMCKGLSGICSTNIVNRTITEMGLQLELGKKMRQDLVNPQSQYNELRRVFDEAIAHAITF